MFSITQKLWENLSNRFPPTNCNNLVPYGTCLGSLVGYGKFHPFILSIIQLTNNARSVLVGIILSDAW